MADIKLLALDMDGTTYKWGGPIVESNIEPIQQALKAGVEVVIVTGRPAISPYNKFEENGFGKVGKSFVVACNGACVYDFKENKILEQTVIDPVTAKKVFELSEKLGLKNSRVLGYVNDLKTAIDSKVFESKEQEDLERRFFDGDYISYDSVKDNWNYSFFKLTGLNINDEFIEELHKLGLEVAVSRLKNCEITAKGVDKGTAVEWLAKKANISKDQIMAIGDGSNDVPMIKYAEYGIALKNSIQEVKDVAKFEVPLTNEQGGVGYAINKWILNKD